jgi:hypothetical protein
MIENSSLLHPILEGTFSFLLSNYTPVIAFSGLCISLYNSYIQRRELNNKRPIIRVLASNYFRISKDGSNSFYLSIQNDGDSPMTIVSIGCEAPSFDKSILIDDLLQRSPISEFIPGNSLEGLRHRRLLPGKDIGLWIPVEYIIRDLKSAGIPLEADLFFFIKDGYQRTYKSSMPISMGNMSGTKEELIAKWIKEATTNTTLKCVFD